ncbi:MAG: hypothetical protein J6J33_03360 [Clostridia bacterium]|nr:hypothetical protein [Clostridia bacterium]
MNIDKIYEKSQQRGLALADKYNKKIGIIESDAKLSEEERQQVYKKLMAKVENADKRLAKSKDVKDYVYYLTGALSENQVANFFSGLIGFSGILAGCLGLLSAGDAAFISEEAMKVVSSISLTFGGLLTGLSAANYKTSSGDSLLDAAESKDMYDNIFKSKALEDVGKKLKGLINEKSAEKEA